MVDNHLDFAPEWERFLTIFGEARHGVLATCAQNRPTARTVSFLLRDDRFYFQTDCKMMKLRQLVENPQVALCADNLQIEGDAHPVGRPLDLENQWFATLFQKYFPSSFENYSPLDDEVVVEIRPTFVILWEYHNHAPSRLYLDPVNRTAWREAYQVANTDH